MTISLDDGLTLQLGEHSYIHDQKIRNPSGALTQVTIGKFCSIATDLTVIGYDHHHEWITTYPFLDDAHRAIWPGTKGIPYPQSREFGSNKSRGDIAIGSDVWIGYNVKLFKGITVGNGAVIGDCSLVNKSVEPYTIVAGTPARIICKRFTDAEIAALERIRWWDWPPELINQYLPFLCSSRILDLEKYLALDPKIQRLKPGATGNGSAALRPQNGAGETAPATATMPAPVPVPRPRRNGGTEIYNSCQYVEGALIFHPRALYHCCIPVKGKFGNTLICEYHGGPLPIDKILASRDQYRHAMASPETSQKLLCHQCIYNKKQAWNSPFLFNNILFNHSMVCNVRCDYCDQRNLDPKSHRPDYDIMPVIHQLIQNRWLAPDSYVMWAGGEPTLLRDFDEALAHMMQFGARNEIATNGTRFSQAIYDNLTRNGRLTLKTSVDCGTPETYLRTKGKNYFDKVWENLRQYASTGAEVSAKYIITNTNTNPADLAGFVNKVKQCGIGWAHLDIDFHFTEKDIKPHHLEAAAFLNTALKEAGVKVVCGLHSLGSVPDLNQRVLAAAKPAANGRPAMSLAQAGLAPILATNYSRPDSASHLIFNRTTASAPRSEAAVTPASPSIVASESLRDFYANATEYFADVVPPQLSELHLRNSSIVPSRDHILPLMPKGGICAEVGTQTGGFAKLILSILRPVKLHIYDIDYTLFDHAHFASAIQKGSVELHQGDSSTLLGMLPDRHFDFIYIDGDHSYNGVVKDLEQSARKIKDDGWIVCNDYTVYSPLEKTKYGVYRAVNEFCLNQGFEIIFLGLHPWGYHDVALRKRTM